MKKMVSQGIEDNEASFATPGDPKHGIGIVLNRIGEVDKKVGSSELDFYVYLVKDGMDYEKNPPKIDFVNGEVYDISAVYTEPGFYEARIKGKFYNPVDYHNFPFEDTKIVIHIEPLFPYNMTYVDFVKDDYSRVSDDVYITGWTVDEPSFSTSVTEYDFE